MLHPVALACEPSRMQNELHVPWSVTYNGATCSQWYFVQHLLTCAGWPCPFCNL